MMIIKLPMGEVSTNDGDGDDDDDNGGFNKTATVITSCLRLCGQAG